MSAGDERKKKSGKKRNKEKSQPIYPTAKNKNKICSVLLSPTRYLDFMQLNAYTGSYDSERNTQLLLRDRAKLSSIIY